MGFRRAGQSGRWPEIVLCVALAAPAVALGQARPEAAIRVASHERFVPIQTDAAGSRKAGPLRTLKFDAYGRRFEVTLEANPRFSTAAAAIQGDGPALTLYQGTLANVAGSWVRMSAKAQSISGLIWDGHELYVVDSASILGLAGAPAGDTIIFRLSDAQFPAGASFCGSEPLPAGANVYDSLIRELKSSRVVMQAVGASLRLEISALGDALFRNRYATDQQAREAILIRLNNVDGIFTSQLGVEIQVPTMNIDDAIASQLSGTTEAGALIEELGRLRDRTAVLKARGLTHLFTGRDLDENTVGIAYTGALCSRRYSASLTQIGPSPTIDSLITAHEIGHNFGAPHDGDPDEACASTPKGQYLMSPSVSVNATTFSQCSLSIILPRMQSASCLMPLSAPDLSIPADLGTRNESVGRTFQWQLEVENKGGSTAISSSARLFVPPVMIIDDVFVPGGTCTSNSDGGAVTCEMGNIPAGSSRVIEMTLHSDVVGSNSIAARVATQNDSDPANDIGDGTLVIDPEADLGIATDIPAQAAVGSNVITTFTASNSAPIDVTGVEVVIAVSDHLSPASAQIAGGTCTVATSLIRCTVSSLAAGASIEGSMSATARNAGLASIRAGISGGYVDPNGANDQAERSVNVIAAATDTSTSSRGGGGAFGILLLLALGGLQLASRGRPN